MSRREEVERLKNQIYGGLSPEIGYDFSGATKALEKLMEMALESVPTHYTPREEVTEGWWSCVRCEMRIPRDIVLVTSGYLFRTATGNRWNIEDMTDFLPVPAWLVEGIET